MNGKMKKEEALQRIIDLRKYLDSFAVSGEALDIAIDALEESIRREGVKVIPRRENHER